MEKKVVRPAIIVTVYSVVGVFFGFSSMFVPAMFLMFEPIDYSALIAFSIGALFTALFFFWGLKPKISFNPNELVIVSQTKRNREITPVFYKTYCIGYNEISDFKGFSNPKDSPVIIKTTGEVVTIDTMSYTFSQIRQLQAELMARTGIWTYECELPGNFIPSLKWELISGFMFVVGLILLFFILPLSAVWLEIWINPAHPPDYQSVTRLTYVLSAMFAGVFIMAPISQRISKKKQALLNDQQREKDRKEVKTLLIIALVLYGVFALAFFLSVTS